MKPFLPLVLMLLITSQIYAQCAYQTNVPKEFYRNRYQPTDAVLSRPFTMFNKTKPNWSLENELSLIRQNIKNQINNNNAYDFALIYRDIYVNAISNEPNKCANDQDGCPHPIWVKNNAVVNLIGLKYERVGIVDKFTELTQAEKDYYGWRAEEGLRNLNPDVALCINVSSYGCEKPSRVAFNLLYYLQAYDMLVASVPCKVLKI